MAPVPPNASTRTKRLARIRGDIHPLAPHKTHRAEASVSDAFLSSKRDKRTMKHSTFISKIQKAHQKPLKRRRPSKKLVATMESLADALPDLTAEDGNIEQLKEGRVRHRSLKRGSGMLKRKEKVVKGEMERFKVTLAKFTSLPESQTAGLAPKSEGDVAAGQRLTAASSTANRWAALRKHISSTMEQNPAFVSQNPAEG